MIGTKQSPCGPMAQGLLFLLAFGWNASSGPRHHLPCGFLTVWLLRRGPLCHGTRRQSLSPQGPSGSVPPLMAVHLIKPGSPRVLSLLTETQPIRVINYVYRYNRYTLTISYWLQVASPSRTQREGITQRHAQREVVVLGGPQICLPQEISASATFPYVQSLAILSGTDSESGSLGRCLRVCISKSSQVTLMPLLGVGTTKTP